MGQKISKTPVDKELDDKIKMNLYMFVFRLLSNEACLRISRDWSPRLVS